jgi:hypothetical protein
LIPSLALLLLAAATAPAYATSSITATGSVTNLTLDGGGSSTTHIVKVADLTMSTDGGLGFAVSISSGTLTKPGGAPIAFKVALVDDGAAPPASTAFTTPSGMSITFATTTAGSVLKDLYILYQSANVQDPGDYSASIVCDITDN